MKNSQQLNTIKKLFELTEDLDAKELPQFTSDCVTENKFAVSHGKFYEHHASTVSAVAFKSFGLWDEFLVALECENPNDAIIDLGRTAEPEICTEDIPAYGWAAMIATSFNLQGISAFHMPLSALIEQASVGDDEKLFQAIRIDATALETTVAASRIAHATLINDCGFFDRLAKAITKTKPSLPSPHLDGTRFALAALDEAEALGGITQEELTDFVVNELRILPPNGDPFSAVRRVRRQRKRLVKGTKS